jgi:hypothetical protein
MKYAHIDNNGQILGWYEDEIHSDIPEPNVQVSEEVWQNALDSSHNTIIGGVTSQVDYRTDEQKADNIRMFRNELLVREVDPVVTNPLRWAELSSAVQQQWTNYRTALLDVPQQSGFPNEVVWPTKP